jgi:phosphatidate phosphatase APP1
VGDSGQSDPEAFANIYEKYGGDKVACIWIVKTIGFNSRAEAVKNSEKRWVFFFNYSSAYMLIDLSELFKRSQQTDGMLSLTPQS